MKDYCNVSDFRCNQLSDSEIIEKCFSFAKENKTETIVFDEKEYHIDRAVLIPSDTVVILDGCHIIQNDFVFDNVFRGDNLQIDENNPNGMPLSVSSVKNIKIIGKNGARITGPCICGKEYHPVMQEFQDRLGDFWGWRTLMISLSYCDGVEISGISFDKTRCWCISFDMCRNGYLHDIRIDSSVKNGDGIDLRSGCHNFLIENITGLTSDDNIACTALFRSNCDYHYPIKNYIYTMEPTQCISNRNSAERDISDITIRNVEVGGMHHGIICLAANGCRVYDINIENVRELSSGIPDAYNQAVVKLYTGYGSGYVKGDLHDISIKNVTGCEAEYTVYCNAEAENVYLENISSKNSAKMHLDYTDGFNFSGCEI